LKDVSFYAIAEIISCAFLGLLELSKPEADTDKQARQKIVIEKITFIKR